MREILFRGKCTDTGKWYEGQYIHLHKTTYCFKEDYDRNPDNDIHQIVFEKMTDWGLPNRHFRADVLPETVGQYTGLRDCKRCEEYPEGQMIFEGDILTYPDSSCFGVVCFGDYDHFDSNHTGFFVKWFENGKRKGFRHDIRFWPSQKAWVVGNIHDNPELLKGGEG